MSTAIKELTKNKYENDKKQYNKRIRRAVKQLKNLSPVEYPFLHKRICVGSGRRDRLISLLSEMLRCREFVYFENQQFFACNLARMSQWGGTVQTWMDTLADLAY